MADQDLRLKSTIEGAQQTAAQLDQIAAAQGRVAEATTQAGDAQDGASLELNDGTVALNEMLNVLRAIDPRIGTFISRMLAGGKALAEFAGSQGSAAATGKALLDSLGKNVATLKLLGAGLIAFGGWKLFTGSMKEAREEAERLQKQLDEMTKSATDQERTLLERQAALTGISRQRPEGGFSAAEEATARETIAQILNRGIAEDLIPALQRNVAALTGVVNAKQIETLTRAGVEIDPTQRSHVRGTLATRALARGATERAAREEERRRAATVRQRQEAAGELVSTDPLEGRANIDTRLGDLSPEVRETAERRAREAIAMMEFFEKLMAERAERGLSTHPFSLQHGLRRQAMAALTARTAVDFVTRTEGFRFSTDEPDPVGQATAVRIVNDYRNARIIGPDADARRRRTSNDVNNVRAAAEQR